MLRVTTIHASSAGDSARYYTRYLAADSPDGKGRWQGRQAHDLGLSGVVSTADLEALLSGHDPVTGRVLGKGLKDRVDARGRLIRAVGGFDATFSAPKSVSILWALTGDHGWADAHDLAVSAVLDHLERYGSTTRIRTRGGRRFPDSGGLIMAAFPQATSREDDPQLHSHVVISAKVQADGGWYALDARYLKRKQRALGGLYQSVLRAELSHRYGVAWGPIENGQAEILGVPEELLETFSKRSAQVDAALTAKVGEFRSREGRDPTRWERAALMREAAQDTRAAKTGADAGVLTERWRHEAAATGWAGNELRRSIADAARGRGRDSTPTVADVIDKVSSKASTWLRVDILQAICDLTPARPALTGRDWAHALERGADEVLSHCTSLDPTDARDERRSDGRSVWIAPIETGHSSEAVLAQEERILSFALEAGLDSEQPSVSVDATGLDVLQLDAARAVAGMDRLVLVVGPAGAGKTAMLSAAVHDLHAHGRAVFAVAPTAKAAAVLRRETGAEADTVAKLLFEWGRAGGPTNDYRLTAGTTIICDEAGMIGTGTLDRLVHLAQSQRWRVVLVGDPHQLHAVGRGGMFDELCRAGRAHELATIHRFHHAWERDASLALRAGRPEAIDAYVDHGRVQAGSFEELAKRAALRWIDLHAAGRRVAVVAETNEHVDTLNQEIQAERRRLGHLGGRSTPVAGGEGVAVGDVVVTRRNDRSIETTSGESIRNRDRWAVTAVDAGGGITVAHDDGHGTAVLPAAYVRDHVRLGYAGTAHTCQGDTVDISLAVITTATTHRSLYVAATRGREENQLLVVTDDAGLAAEDVLEQILVNDRVDTPAVAQRRDRGRQVPGLGALEAEQVVSQARAAYREARARAAPHVDEAALAEKELREARIALQRAEAEAARVPVWRRRRPPDVVSLAARDVARATERHAVAVAAAAPYNREVRNAEERLRAAESVATADRVRQRLEQLSWEEPRHTRTRDRERGMGLEL